MVRDNSNRKVPYGDGQQFRHNPAASAVIGPEFRDSELIDLLRRALAGEGYPVSGGREVEAVQDNQAPLTSRIREILQSDPAPASAAPEPRLPVVDQLQVVEPQLTDESEPAFVSAMPQTPVAASNAEVAMRRDSPAPAVWLPSRRAAGFMLLMALAGGSIPALTASPPDYVAEASLRLIADAGTAPGLLDTTASRLTSSHILSQAVSRLKLEANPEFNGGGATAYGITKDLFTDNGGASDNLSRAQASLRERLTVVREPAAGIIRLSVRSEDASQSIRIANLLAQVAVTDAALSPPGGLQSSASNTGRKAYDDAMAALDDFKAKTGEAKIDTALRLQRQKRDLDSDIARASQAAQAATIHLAAAKTVKLSDVLTGAISPDLGSPAALEDLRNRYASAKGALGVLATQLGPRHPRLLAQQSTVDTLSSNIVSEIQKLVAENEAAARQANEQLKQLKSRAAALDTAIPGLDVAQFDRLQSDVEDKRAAYENELSAPAAPSLATRTAPLALVAPATATLMPSDGSVILGEIYGAIVGFGIAFCAVAMRMVARQLRRDGHERPMGAPGRTQLRREPLSQVAQPPLPRQEGASQMSADLAAPTVDERPIQIAAEHTLAAVDRTVSEARQSVASLRARLETYAAQRPVGR